MLLSWHARPSNTWVLSLAIQCPCHTECASVQRNWRTPLSAYARPSICSALCSHFQLHHPIHSLQHMTNNVSSMKPSFSACLRQEFFHALLSYMALRAFLRHSAHVNFLSWSSVHLSYPLNLHITAQALLL